MSVVGSQLKKLSVVSCRLSVEKDKMSGQSYRELVVWQKSMQLVTNTYLVTESFPKSEMFGLTSQLKRAVVSIPSNIAEGQGRDSTKEFLYHLSVAYGSLMEAETQIQIAINLSFIEKERADRLFDQCGEVGRMLNGLTRSLRKSLNDKKTPRTDNRQLTTDNRQPTTDNRQPTTDN